MKKLLIYSIIFLMVLLASCNQPVDMVANGNQKVEPEALTLENFAKLKSGTPKKVVMQKFGEFNSEYESIVYPSNQVEDVEILFDHNDEVRMIRLIAEDGSQIPFTEWEGREKQENSKNKNTPHKKSDFMNLKVGTPFIEMIEQYGGDCIHVNGGFHKEAYLLEDNHMVIVTFTGEKVIRVVYALDIYSDETEILLPSE